MTSHFDVLPHHRLPMMRRSLSGLLAILLACLALTITASSARAAGPTFASGFSQEVAATGFGNDVTNVTWMSDGSLLVSEQSGLVTMQRNGVKSTFVDLRPYLSDALPGIGLPGDPYIVQGDRGLLGFELDHDGKWLYLLFTQKNHWPGDQNKTAKLIKVPIINNDHADITQAVVLLGLAGTYNTFSCEDIPVTSDCIPSDSTSHSIGSVRQAADGTLYVSTGDGSRFDTGYADPRALRSQNIDSLAGKVLHIDTNGKGLLGNPFYSGNANDNRSKVWAYGFRNPFRMNLQPGSGNPVLGDTQWSTTEEQDYVTKGGNYGWPCYEATPKQPIYASDPATKPTCDALYAKGPGAVVNPIYEYDRVGIGSAAIGGAFYTGTKYPAAYQGAWFFGDYAQNFLKYLVVDNQGNVTTPATTFATNIPVYVGMQMGPDGYLYYASLTTGNIYRIVYTAPGSQPTCGATQFTGTFYSGTALAGTPLATLCSDDLSYNWGYNAPATGVPATNYSATFDATKTFTDGVYTFSTTADDGVRVLIDDQSVAGLDHWVDEGATTYTAQVHLTAGPHKIRLQYYQATGTAQISLRWVASVQHAPVATISSPIDGAKIKPGTTVNFAGTATDVEDGVLPASALSWTINIKHCADVALTNCHYHPLLSSYPGASGSFVYPDHGPLEIYYVELTLTATDSTGLVSTVTEKLYPSFPPPTTTCAAGQFTASYYAGITLAGTPLTTSCTDTVNFNWQYGSPAPNVPADNFSASYQATKTFTADTYRFSLTSDDGGRLFIDGQTVPTINQWADQGATTNSADVALTAGLHDIKVEYYENTGTAQVALAYVPVATAPIGSPAGGWQAQFWNTPGSATAPVYPTTKPDATRVDPSISLDGNYNSPAPGIAADHFVAQWSGQLNLQAGTYQVTTLADDGIRVLVNAQTVLDQWRDQGPTPGTATFTVAAGLSNVVIWYYQNTGGATAHVSFAPTTLVTPPPAGCAAGQWSAQYFANITLAGAATDGGCSATLSYDWGYGSPLPSLPADHFSARYTMVQTITAGARTITIRGDDGVRFLIDGQIVTGLDGWRDQGATTYQADVTLTAGSHTFVLEYYENTGTAEVSAVISDPVKDMGNPATGWQAQYWNTPGAGTSPLVPTSPATLTRTESSIANKWGYGSPDPTISGDHFVARWTGSYNLGPGTYQLSTTADDGIRATVNGQLILDNWVDQGATTTTKSFVITATAGATVPIIIEYYENTGTASASFNLQKTG
jgi:hypothetical protein